MNAIMDLNSKIVRHNGNSPDRRSKKEYSDEKDRDLYVNKSGNK